MTYARGDKAWGICQRSGKRVLRKDMLEDGHLEGMLVAQEWWEPRHPQEIPVDVYDPQAIYRPTPEEENALPINPDGLARIVFAMHGLLAYTLEHVVTLPACPTLASPTEGSEIVAEGAVLTAATFVEALPVLAVTFYYRLAADMSFTSIAGINDGEIAGTTTWYCSPTLAAGESYVYYATATNADGVSVGCEASLVAFTTEEVIENGWDISTANFDVHVTNGNRDASALPEENLNRCVKSFPGLGTKMYAEVYLVGDTYANEASWPYFPDPISIGLATVASNPAFSGTLAGTTGSYGFQISGTYQTQTTGGATAGYENGSIVSSTARPGSVSGSRRRVMIAWNKALGKLYMGFGGTWVWGDPSGAVVAKPAFNVPAATDLRLLVINIIQARGAFTAADLTHALPATYTAWDGTT